jgi:methanogenic corrinoid protein MtbC1
MLQRTVEAYAEAVIDTDRDRALSVIRSAMRRGLPPEDALFKVVVPSIERMATSISESFDANLAQHFMASQIAAEVTEEVIPRFKTAPKPIGRMVIGTSAGDFHGLGKRIVVGCLKCYLIDTIDLGLNVPPDRFVEAAVAHRAQVIGISSMMVHTARAATGCLGVRRLLRQRHLQGRIKVIVGGAPYRFDHDLYRVVEADAWAEDGIQAGPAIVKLLREI